jgi:membrane fusion protein, heavy metal efflux system
MTKQRCWQTLATLAILALGGSRGLAHEGHMPLPTKGVEVDIAKGLLTLSQEARDALGVQSTAVETQDLHEVALAYATLVAPWKAKYFVSSRVAGQIATLSVQSGEIVKAGQVLAEVTSPELERLRLDYGTAINDANLSRQQLERIRPLASSGVLAEKDLLEAQMKFELDRNAVEITRLQLTSLGIEMPSESQELGNGNTPLTTGFLPIVSPISGTVSHSDLAVGKIVDANEHLFEVHDPTNLWVRIEVLERDIAKIKIGQQLQLELSAYPRDPMVCTITAASRYLDPISHVATFWGEISNPSSTDVKYLPGMVGTARINVSEPTIRLSVPNSALFRQGAEHYVLVEVAATNRASEYRRQSVHPLSKSTEYTQVDEGAIFPGDQVVTTGAHVLSSFFILGSLRLSDEGIRNIGLKIEPVTARTVDKIIEFNGIVELPPANRASVNSQVSGTLKAILIERGGTVHKGDILANMDSLEFLQSQLNLIRTEREASLLKTTFDRLEDLGKGLSPAIARKNIYELEAQWKAAANRHASIRRQLLAAGLPAESIDQIVETKTVLDSYPIRAPIDGTVVSMDANLGQLIDTDQQLFEIHDLSKHQIQGFLSESDAPMVHAGLPVRLRFARDPDVTYDGIIRRTERLIDGQNRTMSVWIETNGSAPESLERNSAVQIVARIQGGISQIAVPLTAIVQEYSRSYVFVQKGDGILERRSVELGDFDDQYVTVTHGLAGGEAIAVQGAEELQTAFSSIR